MPGILIIIVILFILIVASSGNKGKSKTENNNNSSTKSPKPVIQQTSLPASKTAPTLKPAIVPSVHVRNSPSALRPRVPTMARKPNWRDFEKLVVEKKIKTLYHFTDKRNILSIKKHGGLYSWSYCAAHKITIPVPASNDLSKSLDTQKGFEDYVRLSFNPFQPMMYVVKKKGVHPVVLEISPEVIYWLDTQFSNINATANNAIVGSTISHFKNINFPLALQGDWTTQDEKSLIQAEVLIKTKLPIHFIKNI